MGLDRRPRPAPAQSACAAAKTTGNSCPAATWGSAAQSRPSWCPSAVAITVAVRRTIPRALATLGADQLTDLGLHQLQRDRPHRLADHIAMLLAQHPPDDLLDRHPVPPGHRRPPFRRTLRSPTNNERRGGRNYLWQEAIPSDSVL